MFGLVEAAHYIFASFKPVGRFNGREVIGSRITEFDPTTPIGSWKKAWRKLTKEAGLSGLRFHDLRHHAITELFTNPNISIQTTKSIAGHVSERMVDRYAHIRLEAKRKAVESLSRKGAQVKGNGTIDGTKTTWRDREIQKVPIKLVGAWGFEPQTPTVPTPSLLTSHNA
jgi:integrase-like protein